LLFLLPQVDDLPSAGVIYLQLDGVPSHYSDLVRAALDEKFPQKMDRLKWTCILVSQKPEFNYS
jgi:hypothetical protein